MTDLNMIALVGRLTRDAEIRTSQNGTPIANMSLAFNRSVKTGDEWGEEAGFIDVTLFGKLAESLGPYLLKGKQVAVNGQIRMDRWEDKATGQKRSKITMVCNNFGGIQLLGGRNDSAGDNGNEVKHVSAATVASVFGEDEIPF